MDFGTVLNPSLTTSSAVFKPPHKTLTMSELPPLLKEALPGLAGMLRREASLLPPLGTRERSEFQGSKLEGGRKGGITAFSLSLGSRVRGAPLLNWGRNAGGGRIHES